MNVMKKVLILSFYYPPAGGVSVFRPLSWAKYFHKYGFTPVVISRHWNGNEVNWEDYQKEINDKIKTVENKNSKTIYLPYKKNPYLKAGEKKWMQRSGLNKFIYPFLAVRGYFQPEVDAYNCYKDFLFEHLKTEKYELLIITVPPLGLIRLASEISNRFNIPFVVDFQDSWDNRILGEGYVPNFMDRSYNFLMRSYLRKWLKKALFITTVTPAIAEHLKKTSNTPIEIITNGFDPEMYREKDMQLAKEFFNVSVMGTIHPMQDITIMLEGLNLFLKDKNPETLKLNFVGTSSFPEILQKIKTSLPAEFLNISPRVNMLRSAELTLAANILLFPSYKGFKGYYTAKIFEYLGSGRNILMVPGNKDIVEDLIKKTKTGKIANTPKEFSEMLNTWYSEWQQTGTLKYEGIEKEINFFTRENQSRLFCNAIKKYLALTCIMLFYILPH